MQPKILVVEDEPLLRWSVAETLNGRGYQVAEAGDAASAMRSLFTHARPGVDSRADVVLLDLFLPDSTDLRLLAAMHAARPDTPVILMTAYGTREVASDARRLGAFAVLDKPFDMNDLGPLVDRALRREPNEAHYR
jgi:DNA-binding NtrC family response regulator